VQLAVEIVVRGFRFALGKAEAMMMTNLKSAVLSVTSTIALTTTMIVGFNPVVAAASPSAVRCGSGTHAVVNFPVVNGHRTRQVTCVRNRAVAHRAIGTTGTVVKCGPGTHAVVHHPLIDGRRVRQTVCVG
jgi:hypothetical protein